MRKSSKQFIILCKPEPASNKIFKSIRHNIKSFIKDDQQLKNALKSRRKSEVVLKKRFDSKPLSDEICLKAKIKSDDGKVNTNCYDNEFLKKSCNCICQSLISIDSIIGTSKNCYPQILLEE